MNIKTSLFALTALFIGALQPTTSFYTPLEARDLELFVSPAQSHHGFISLFEKYCRTVTGREALKAFFQNPCENVPDIISRQNAVKALAADISFFRATALCESIAKNETALSELVAFNTNPAFHDVLKTFYFNVEMLKGLNNSPTALNTLYYAELMTQLGPIFEHILLHNLLGSCGHDHAHEGGSVSVPEASTGAHKPGGCCGGSHDAGCHDEHDHAAHSENPCAGVPSSAPSSVDTGNPGTVVAATAAPSRTQTKPHAHSSSCGDRCTGAPQPASAGEKWWITQKWDTFQSDLHVFIQTHQRLATAIKYAHIPILVFSLAGSMKFNGERRQTINHLQSALVRLACVVNQARALAWSPLPLPGLENYSLHLKNVFQTASGSFKECLETLLSPSFEEQREAWVLTPVGKTLYTVSLVLEHEKELQKLIAIMGEIDALRAAAECIRSDKEPWTYTSFIDAPAPRVECAEMRNPLLAQGRAVTDTCFWGAPYDSHIVLSGPNRAGKTTYLKALAYNVLLSHVFGIAAARTATMTPFKGLVTFMSLNDDLVNDQSRYVAQIARMGDIMRRVTACKENEFMMVLLDDSVGQGSTHEVNEKIAYEFFKLFGAHNNTLFIGATHFERLTNLATETNGVYKNYRMRILPGTGGGTALSAYSVEPGVADFGQVLALVS